MSSVCEKLAVGTEFKGLVPNEMALGNTEMFVCVCTLAQNVVWNGLITSKRQVNPIYYQ